MARCTKKSRRGELNTEVRVQRQTRTQDPILLKYDYVWTTVYNVRGKVTPTGGLRFIRSNRLEPEITHMVKIRYNPDITRDDRILFDGNEHKIVKLIHDTSDGRNSMLEIYVEEVDART